jgi:predicted CXXCH cytochrome family protein
MSKKSLVLLVVTALTLSLALAVSMSFAADDKGPAEITLNADGTKPVLFPHAKHQAMPADKAAITCGTCHHYQDAAGARVACADDTLDKIAKCDSCHNADFANEKLRTWKDIGHGLCKDCHTKLKDMGAPTKCNDCHSIKK